MRKDILLYINNINQVTVDSIHKYNKNRKSKFKIAVLLHSKKVLDKKSIKAKLKNVDISTLDYILVEDFNKDVKILKALSTLQDRIKAVTCRGERHMQWFKKVLPHIPYVLSPTQKSIEWAYSKIDMRRHFRAYDPSITPKYTVIKKFDEDSIDKIMAKVGLPVVVKPSGLASSMFVTVCFHQDELEKTLKRIIKKVKSTYNDFDKEIETRILVEQFMEGEMYSLDGYVDEFGGIVFCPMAHVKTGRSKGYDDFFGYMRITPTTLSQEKINSAEEVAESGVHALALRSTTVHIELMKTDDGWKIIEIGARIGGFRHDMYLLSFGIDHGLNDILNKMGKKIVLPKRRKGYTAALQYFPKEEGEIIQILGLKKIKKFASFYSMEQKKKVGEVAKFAKNGGESVINVILHNKTRSGLLADVRRCEEFIKIEVDS